LSFLTLFLTYLIPIPFAAFLFNVLGRGLFSSILLFFISTILYAAGAMIYDLFSTQGPLSPSIGTGVLAFWCMLAGINIILIREQNNPETTVLKFTLFFFLLSLAYDNLVVMNLLPWTFRLEHIDVLVLFTGMAFIAVRREKNRRKINSDQTG
jgi:predicted tellurium resistance membrane protein TerC